MGYRSGRSQHPRLLLSKAATFLLLFSLVFSPFITFAQVQNSSVQQQNSASSGTVPTATPVSNTGTLSSNPFSIPIGPIIDSSSSDTEPAANTAEQTPSTSNTAPEESEPGTQSPDPIPETAFEQPVDDSAKTDAKVADPMTLSSPTVSGDVSPDLTRKTIEPRFYSEPDPVTGSLTYKYPISIPPGRNKLQPNLNLVYSSQPG